MKKIFFKYTNSIVFAIFFSTMTGCGVLPKFTDKDASPMPPRIWSANEFFSSGGANRQKPKTGKFISLVPLPLESESQPPSQKPTLPSPAPAPALLSQKPTPPSPAPVILSQDPTPPSQAPAVPSQKPTPPASALVDAVMPDGVSVEPDQCWAQMVIPPRKKVVVRQVVTKEGRDSYDVQPASLKHLKQTVTLRDAAHTYRIEPPQYKKVTEQIKVKDEIKEIVIQPAVYRDEKEEVMVESERVEIRSCRALGQRIAGTRQTSASANHCAVLVPATYKTVTRKVLVQAETVHEKITPAKYETVEKWVLVEDGKAVVTYLPPEEIEKNVVAVDVASQALPRSVPADMRDIKVATYENVPRLTWRQVVCERDASSEMVKNLQSALKNQGLDVVIDGKLGDRTLRAVTDYQTNQGMANGYLTYETLEALGLGKASK